MQARLHVCEAAIWGLLGYKALCEYRRETGKEGVGVQCDSKVCASVVPNGDTHSTGESWWSFKNKIYNNVNLGLQSSNSCWVVGE